MKMADYDAKECVVTCLPIEPRGRPLLELNIAYITALRQAGGVVNTAIVMTAAKGILSS